MSDEANLIRWHNNGRGPRVIVTLANEDHVMDVAHAQKLYVALGKVLYQIDASGGCRDTRGDAP